jgi:predicted dehydrogenase
MTHPTSPNGVGRRDFLATAGLSTAALLSALPAVHAAVGSSETLKIGLVGCGGRGTGAAAQALSADPNVKLHAMGDMFEDRLKSALNGLKGDDKLGKKVDVPAERQFLGWDAYDRVIKSGVDVVLLTTPPAFRPMHLEAAVAAGKHIFCEKPMAVDAPGVRSVIESCKKAKTKNLCVVSGFCYRYQKLKREFMKQVHGGEIGKIVALHCTYHAGALWNRPREKGWDDMTAQLRNWPYFTWLSGDHIVEQAIHSIDKMSWAMQDEPPARAIGLGGRQSRTGQDFGHIFDHHSVVYEYKSGVKLFHSCRQQKGTKGGVSDFVYGTEGVAEILNQETHRVKGKRGEWKRERRLQRNDDMYQNEHNELFAAIRAGKPINDGEWMTRSTLLAIMGRMATYTGQEITWKMAMDSEEKLLPEKLAFGPIATPEVAKPGITKFK